MVFYYFFEISWTKRVFHCSVREITPSFCRKAEQRIGSMPSVAGRLIGLSENLMSKAVHPSRSSIARRLWHLDSASALLVADCFSKFSLHCDTNNFMAFLFSDSSPRVGRHLLLPEVFVLIYSGCHGSMRRIAFKYYSKAAKSAQHISKMLNCKLYKDMIKSRLLCGPHLENARAAIDEGYIQIMTHRFLAFQQFLDDILVL